MGYMEFAEWYLKAFNDASKDDVNAAWEEARKEKEREEERKEREREEARKEREREREREEARKEREREEARKARSKVMDVAKSKTVSDEDATIVLACVDRRDTNIIDSILLDNVDWDVLVKHCRKLATPVPSASSGQGVLYRVLASVENAKKKRGIRAAIYKFAEEHHARYVDDALKSVYYEKDSDTLRIQLLFLTVQNAEDFQTTLGMWYLRSPLLGLDGSVHVEEQVQAVTIAGQPSRVLLRHYEGKDTESPMASLQDFKSDSSCTTAAVGTDDPLLLFQSIENPQLFSVVNAYCLHIKDKARFKALKNDKNNMLAGSWTPFRQFFDGLMTVDNLPQLAIRPVKFVREEWVGEPARKRARVEVAVEFRSMEAERQMSSRFKDGSQRERDLHWQSFVHVEDAQLFMECLEWKYKSTKERWTDFDSM